MPFTVYVSAGSMKSGCEVSEIVIDPPFLASPPPPPLVSASIVVTAAGGDDGHGERAARRSTSARLPSFPIQNPSRFVSAGRSGPPAGRYPSDRGLLSPSLRQKCALNAGVNAAAPRASPQATLRIRRETCICDRPTRWAICVCGRPSSKRIRRISARAAPAAPARAAGRRGPPTARSRRPRRRSSRAGSRPRRSVQWTATRSSTRTHLHGLEHLSGWSSAPPRSRRCSASGRAGRSGARSRRTSTRSAPAARAGHGSPSPCRGSA